MVLCVLTILNNNLIPEFSSLNLNISPYFWKNKMLLKGGSNISNFLKSGKIVGATGKYSFNKLIGCQHALNCTVTVYMFMKHMRDALFQQVVSNYENQTNLFLVHHLQIF